MKRSLILTSNLPRWKKALRRAQAYGVNGREMGRLMKFIDSFNEKDLRTYDGVPLSESYTTLKPYRRYTLTFCQEQCSSYVQIERV